MSNLPLDVPLVVCGDLNARIRNLSPTLADTAASELECGRIAKIVLENLGTVLTERGMKLIAFCDVHELTPLNGLNSFEKSFEFCHTSPKYKGR